MSKQEMMLWSLSLVAASFAIRCRTLPERSDASALDAARETFAATFPDDAALLVVDTVGEVVEVES